MPITMHDVLTRRATEPGQPAEPLWRTVTFEGARPQEKVWVSKAMRKMMPKHWRRIRVVTRYRSYVRFHSYDPAAFAHVDDAWIEEMWLKLLLLQES